MRQKQPEPQKIPRRRLEEHWADRVELGGSKSVHVACYAANQVLNSVWRGAKESADTRSSATRRLCCG